MTGTDGEQPAHLGRVAGSDDHLRGEQEVRRVVGRGMTVQGHGTDTGRVTGRLDQCIDQGVDIVVDMVKEVTPGAGHERRWAHWGGTRARHRLGPRRSVEAAARSNA